MHMATPTANGMGIDPDFDLDVSIVESAPAVTDLMRATDNGCGTTCQSACTSCKS